VCARTRSDWNNAWAHGDRNLQKSILIISRELSQRVSGTLIFWHGESFERSGCTEAFVADKRVLKVRENIACRNNNLGQA
jgi:hypothetical protein